MVRLFTALVTKVWMKAAKGAIVPSVELQTDSRVVLRNSNLRPLSYFCQIFKYFYLSVESNSRLLKWFEFALLHVIIMIGLKNSRHFLTQSRVKAKHIVTSAHTFSRALCQLHRFASSFDWLTGFSVCFWLASATNLIFVWQHSSQDFSIYMEVR